MLGHRNFNLFVLVVMMTGQNVILKNAIYQLILMELVKKLENI